MIKLRIEALPDDVQDMLARLTAAEARGELELVSVSRQYANTRRPARRAGAGLYGHTAYGRAHMQIKNAIDKIDFAILSEYTQKEQSADGSLLWPEICGRGARTQCARCIKATTAATRWTCRARSSGS